MRIIIIMHISHVCQARSMEAFDSKSMTKIKNPRSFKTSRVFVELITRFERVTSSLPRMCSAYWAISADTGLPACTLAGAEGFEPSARGFGDHCSTSWAIPLYGACLLYNIKSLFVKSPNEKNCTTLFCTFWQLVQNSGSPQYAALQRATVGHAFHQGSVGEIFVLGVLFAEGAVTRIDLEEVKDKHEQGRYGRQSRKPAKQLFHDKSPSVKW